MTTVLRLDKGARSAVMSSLLIATILLMLLGGGLAAQTQPQTRPDQAEKPPAPEWDTLQVVVDRGPYVAPDTILSGACGITVSINELAFADSTFVRNSGNFTHALFGEGGTGAKGAFDFARTMAYNGERTITNTTCTATLSTIFPYSSCSL